MGARAERKDTLADPLAQANDSPGRDIFLVLRKIRPGALRTPICGREKAEKKSLLRQVVLGTYRMWGMAQTSNGFSEFLQADRHFDFAEEAACVLREVQLLASFPGLGTVVPMAAKSLGCVDCRILPSGRSARIAPIESFPEGAMDRALENVESQVKARMARVDHIIAIIDVLNIDVVIIAPA